MFVKFGDIHETCLEFFLELWQGWKTKGSSVLWTHPIEPLDPPTGPWWGHRQLLEKLLWKKDLPRHVRLRCHSAHRIKKAVRFVRPSTSVFCIIVWHCLYYTQFLKFRPNITFFIKKTIFYYIPKIRKLRNRNTAKIKRPAAMSNSD